ncbi:unnamed protein product [Blepharisma stoltei]|uniref:Uncharacterized protein n=1 Tax=Blepharisma stoltei TaxID=1481888 RepID=A0AAU9JBT0_9CILI|nr:unnamed protein product [Blepharisma stoltei]
MQNRKAKIWDEKDDEFIKTLVEEFGDKNWIIISQKLEERYNVKGRTGKQCRERWHNHINPKIIKEAWTKEEEKTLFEYQRIYGNKWSEIARYLPGRSDNSIKNQFYSTVRKNLRRYNKRRPQSERIVGNVKQVLQNPTYYALLATSSEISKVKASKNEQIKPEIKKNAENSPCKDEVSNSSKIPENAQDETPNILCSLYEEPKEKAHINNTHRYQIEVTKSEEVKTEPSAPVYNLADIQAEFLYKKTTIGMFKFPEDFPICNWDSPDPFEGVFLRGDSLGGLQEPCQDLQHSDSLQSLKRYDSSSGWKSDVSMDFLMQLRASSLNSYTLPPFSPMDSFQHINTNSRNNN